MEKNSALLNVIDKEEKMQFIIFRVGDEEFGVPIGRVQEIIKVGIVTPIPDSPKFIKGLINVRGDIVAIIDVKARFSLVALDEPAKHIVIAKQDESLFGLMVDEVMEVLRVGESDIKTPPKLMNRIHEEYVKGVLTHGDRIIIMLDLDEVLSEEELERLADLTRNGKDTNMIDQREKILSLDADLDMQAKPFNKNK